MKTRKWTVREVAEATGNTVDSVGGYLTNRNKKYSDGMSIEEVLDYIRTEKRDRVKVNRQAVEDLREILSLLED